MTAKNTGSAPGLSEAPTAVIVKRTSSEHRLAVRKTGLALRRWSFLLIAAAIACPRLSHAAIMANDGLARPEPWPLGSAIPTEVAGCAILAGAGAAVGASCGLLVWNITTSGYKSMSDPKAATYALIGALAIGYPVGCAAGTYAGGSIARQRGRFDGALRGAYIAGAIPSAVVLFARGPWFPTQWRSNIGSVASIGVFAAIPIGALIGYNRTRPKESAPTSWLPQWLDMPRVIPTVTYDEINRPVAGVRLCLLTGAF